MRVKFYVSTGYVGSDRTEVVDIPDEDIADASEEELEEYINELLQQWVWENVDSSWSKV